MLGRARLENMLAEKPALMKLVTLLFCVDVSWKIPKPMYSKAFARGCMLDWAAKFDLDARVGIIKLRPDLTIDWCLSSPYQLRPARPQRSDDESVRVSEQILHVSGKQDPCCG